MPQAVARHLHEAGRIRIGTQVPIAGGRNAGKPRPERLKHFRLTSNSRPALERAAQKYGGTVQAWTIRPEWRETVRVPDHAWELFTQADTLDVIMRGDSLMNTMWERWEGAYCALRCDGQVILKDGRGVLTGRPCICPEDHDERKAAAAKGVACTEVSRVTVMLEGLPLGQWRLDTHGFYAPAEIRGLQDLLADCEVGRAVLKATMRLEHRTDHKMVQGERQTLVYPCIVIEPRNTIDALLAEGVRRRELEGPRPDEHQKTLAAHIEDLYGPTPARMAAASPIPQAVPPVASLVPDSAPADTAALRQEIDDWQAAHGMTSQQRMQWRGQHVRRLKARSFAHLSREVLMGLWTDLREDPDPDEDDTQTVSAWTVGAAGTVAPAWREALAQGAAHLREFLGGDGQSADHREAILELTTHALALAEDPDATEAAGQGCLTAMRQLGDDVARQLGLPL